MTCAFCHRPLEEHSLATADACPCYIGPEDRLRCTIRGFLIDNRYQAEKPTADYTTAGRTKIMPRGGVEYDWQHWSLIYQKRLRALTKLICKEGFTVSSDGNGMPYRLTKHDQR